MKYLITICLNCLFLCLCSSDGVAEQFGTIHFADKVIRYIPDYSGGKVPGVTYTNPIYALGWPDNTGVSLGSGGLIELGLLSGYISNSGDGLYELYVYENPPEDERTYVAVRPTPETAALLGPSYDQNGDGFYEVGRGVGHTDTFDIDLVFPGFPPGSLIFDAIQLIDDTTQGSTSGSTVGADIMAVGAVDYRCGSHLQGDLNSDCVVNLCDFAIMAQNWLIDCNNDPDNLACHPVLNLEGSWLISKGDDLQWNSPTFDDSAWQQVVVPDKWENYPGYEVYNGFGWYRKRFVIPQAWAGHDLNLILGRIDDCDETYFNGEFIGSTGQMPPDPVGNYMKLRQYSIPANLIQYGKENCVAVRVYDSRDQGGIYSGPLRIEIE